MDINSHCMTMSNSMRLRGKQCAAFSLIALLLFSSFWEPLFSSVSTVSYRKLGRYFLYAATVVLGCIYVWERLVADIESSLQYGNDSLPLRNGGRLETSKIGFINPKLPPTSQNKLFKVWKLFLATFLFVVILGYVRMHTHKRNTFFSQFDTFCFMLLGAGAFLTLSLFMLDFLLLGIFICKGFITLFGSERAAEFSSENEVDCDTPSVRDVFNFLSMPRKNYHHWRTISDELISSVWKVVLVVSVTFGVTLYGLNRAHRTLDVTELRIPVRVLPTSLEDFRIVQICDFHVGPWLWTDHVSRVVDKVNELDADAIVIVGDLVDLTLDLVVDALEPLKHLKARRGVFFVAGNHDYYLGDVDSLTDYLEYIGIIVLNNQNVKICLGGSTSRGCFYLIGTEDISQGEATDEKSGHSFQLVRAMEGVDPELPAVLLTHQPLGAKKAISTDHRFDLILSGHTHGGQFFPVSLLVYLSVPYFYGLYHVREDTHLYVSSGVGFWGIPMRFMAPPEVAVLSLTSGQSEYSQLSGDHVLTRNMDE